MLRFSNLQDVQCLEPSLRDHLFCPAKVVSQDHLSLITDLYIDNILAIHAYENFLSRRVVTHDRGHPIQILEQEEDQYLMTKLLSLFSRKELYVNVPVSLMVRKLEINKIYKMTLIN